MGNSPYSLAPIESAGLSICIEGDHQIASLRYFDPAGRFAAAVHETLGRPLAEALCAIHIEQAPGGGRCILLWRSPTENLLLMSDPAAFLELERQLAAAADGCMVDQTGGLRAVRVAGHRARELLLRLGAATAIPKPGEARSGRLAELNVLMSCLQAGDYLLLVERVYANHLLGWMGETAADF